MSEMDTLCGSKRALPWPWRLPSTMAATRAEKPEEMCTTVPPAKSRMPARCRKPSVAHTECATGQYTMSSQADMKTSSEENFMRSARPPVMSAGVMMANVIWNVCARWARATAVRASAAGRRRAEHAAHAQCKRTMKTDSGMVGASGCTAQFSMPSSQKRSAPPMTAVPSRKASE